jgi:hypothetical protein
MSSAFKDFSLSLDEPLDQHGNEDAFNDDADD